MLAGSAGIWLFYVQHQFEDTYWERGGDWTYSDAGLRGSSFLKLPQPLQWFTGNIGFHHVHHLCALIPTTTSSARTRRTTSSRACRPSPSGTACAPRASSSGTRTSVAWSPSPRRGPRCGSRPPPPRTRQPPNRIEAFTDRRVFRYWELVGIINGWPDARRAANAAGQTHGSGTPKHCECTHKTVWQRHSEGRAARAPCGRAGESL